MDVLRDFCSSVPLAFYDIPSIDHFLSQLLTQSPLTATRHNAFHRPSGALSISVFAVLIVALLRPELLMLSGWLVMGALLGDGDTLRVQRGTFGLGMGHNMHAHERNGGANEQGRACVVCGSCILVASCVVDTFTPRIREILTCDGGLERLVRLLDPPASENPSATYGLSPPLLP